MKSFVLSLAILAVGLLQTGTVVQAQTSGDSIAARDAYDEKHTDAMSAGFWASSAIGQANTKKSEAESALADAYFEMILAQVPEQNRNDFADAVQQYIDDGDDLYATASTQYTSGGTLYELAEETFGDSSTGWSVNHNNSGFAAAIAAANTAKGYLLDAITSYNSGKTNADSAKQKFGTAVDWATNWEEYQ